MDSSFFFVLFYAAGLSRDLYTPFYEEIKMVYIGGIIMFNLIEILIVATIVGIGLAVGKYIGGFVTTLLDMIVTKLFGKMAKDGNKTAQEICRRGRINYGGAKNTNKNQIGFRLK